MRFNSSYIIRVPVGELLRFESNNALVWHNLNRQKANVLYLFLTMLHVSHVYLFFYLIKHIDVVVHNESAKIHNDNISWKKYSQMGLHENEVDNNTNHMK